MDMHTKEIFSIDLDWESDDEEDITSDRVVSPALEHSSWILEYASSTTLLSLVRTDVGSKDIMISYHFLGEDVSIFDQHIFTTKSSSKAILAKQHGNISQDCVLSDTQSVKCRVLYWDVPQFKLLHSNPEIWKISKTWDIPRSFIETPMWKISNSIFLPGGFQHNTLRVIFENEGKISFTLEQAIDMDIFIGGSISHEEDRSKRFASHWSHGTVKKDICQLSIPQQQTDSCLKTFKLSCELLLTKHLPSEITFLCPSIEPVSRPVGSSVSLLEALSRDMESIYKDAEFTNIKLKAEDKVFDANQAVLCARSPVFRAMFDADMVEKNTKVIEVQDLDAETLDAMLKYVYSGKAELDVDSAVKLYYAGDKYEMIDLKKACSVFLESNLTLENVFGILIMSENHNDEEFMSTVQDFIINRASEIFNMDSWNKFMLEKPLLAAKTMQAYLKRQITF